MLPTTLNVEMCLLFFSVSHQKHWNRDIWITTVAKYFFTDIPITDLKMEKKICLGNKLALWKNKTKHPSSIKAYLWYKLWCVSSAVEMKVLKTVKNMFHLFMVGAHCPSSPCSSQTGVRMRYARLSDCRHLVTCLTHTFTLKLTFSAAENSQHHVTEC